jgi:hypothetical protein
MTKIIFVLFSFLISVGVASADGDKIPRVGDHLILKPNDTMPETPAGALWQVTKISSEKLKTKNGTPTNYSIPTMEVELVSSDLKTIKDEVSLVAVGDYVRGSHGAIHYLVTLKSDMGLVVEELTTFTAVIEKVLIVDNTIMKVLRKEELPILPEGYVWEAVSVLDVRRDFNSSLTKYVLKKTDFDLPDKFTLQNIYGADVKDQKTFEHRTMCFSQMNTMVRH